MTIMWCMKSATSRMNSSNGSTPKIDSDNGGRTEECLCPFPFGFCEVDALLSGEEVEWRARFAGLS